MRLGVLDVGSNTVHLLVVDAYPGARPMPAFSHKTELKLAAQLENGNSLPLGAGRLSREWISTDPPSAQEVRRMRKHVRAEIAREAGGMLRHGPPDQVVGTSKTFRQLARIAGAAPSGDGPYVKRVLRHSDVAALAERLPKMTQADWAMLPGVSAGRVPQLPAGALVADAICDLLGVDQLELCPWALREGVILRRLDLLAQGLGAL